LENTQRLELEDIRKSIRNKAKKEKKYRAIKERKWFSLVSKEKKKLENNLKNSSKLIDFSIHKKREKNLAVDVNGSSHPRSGALWFSKSDVDDKFFQYEDKYTFKDFYTLSIHILNKIEREAIDSNKIPILRFGFLNKNKISVADFVVVRKKDCNFRGKKAIKDFFYTKSHRFYLGYLMSAYIRTDTIIMELTLYDKEYVILMWEDFLRNKYNILNRRAII